jgi:hypothetical protein
VPAARLLISRISAPAFKPANAKWNISHSNQNTTTQRFRKAHIKLSCQGLTASGAAVSRLQCLKVMLTPAKASEGSRLKGDSRLIPTPKCHQNNSFSL